ncbi:hypothetical protein [Rathayibacter sp. Leaf248]|uniref:hypothetical protein n=1 Tax=Rathayibacter sp. Leaf248 TaxID=2876555 RepID=UPI001E56F987|nr:hypothetical protein [Rathayibacter sp. Leaf248]
MTLIGTVAVVLLALAGLGILITAIGFSLFLNAIMAPPPVVRGVVATPPQTTLTMSQAIARAIAELGAAVSKFFRFAFGEPAKYFASARAARSPVKERKFYGLAFIYLGIDIALATGILAVIALLANQLVATPASDTPTESPSLSPTPTETPTDPA